MKLFAKRLRFRHAAPLQLALLMLAACVWFYFKTVAYLNGPPDPDLYAWSWGFQLIVFFLFHVPKLLLGWLLLILLEFGLFRLYHRFHGRRANAEASEA